MNSIWPLRIVGVALFTVIFLRADSPPIVMIGGRSVAIRLIQAQDRRPVEWPGGPVEIVTELVDAGPDLNIPDRLAANGIEPDVGSYTLFYDLNPGITKADGLPAGAKLFLPKVVGSPALKAKLADRAHFVVLLVDLELRRELYDASAPLSPLAERFAKLPLERFASDSERVAITMRVADIAAWYEHIRSTDRQRKGPPFKRESLIQLRDEAKAANSVLQTIILGTGKVSSADMDQIYAIHQDLEREIKRYDDVMSGALPDPDLGACCLVLVTIESRSPGSIERLRVYYTMNGLFRPPPPQPIGTIGFPELGSGRSVRLRSKNYVFWAAPDGQPEQFMTEPVMVPVSPSPNQKPISVQLLLKEKRNE